MSSARYDVCVIGAGLIGLTTARALVEHGASVLVLEKEEAVAIHQSGHSSGVVHSGLYYKPGSLKSRLTVEGARRMYEFCESNEIVHRRSGKLVIATRESEIPALEELHRRGSANGLSGLRRIEAAEIAEVEPAAHGVAALHVPEAGVADFAGVAAALADQLTRDGADIRLGHRVEAISQGVDGVEVVANETVFHSERLVNCGGLHSDRVASMAGVKSDVRIIPFRGEYYTLEPEQADLVKALIYPVPDPRFPFLGVHFTRRWNDSVEVGPNALLALAREQYRGVGVDFGDLADVVSFAGFWKLAGRHFGAGARELFNSKSRHQYARLARRLVPEVRAEHLQRGGAGVRAQAVDRAGRLVDDFVFETTGATIHVLNAPSPGGTASFAIGDHIAAKLRSSV